MWENINANYTEEYGSLLKVKNQVNIPITLMKYYNKVELRTNSFIYIIYTNHSLQERKILGAMLFQGIIIAIRSRLC